MRSFVALAVLCAAFVAAAPHPQRGTNPADFDGRQARGVAVVYDVVDPLVGDAALPTLLGRDLGLRQLPDPSPDGIIADITGAVDSVIGEVLGDVYSITGEVSGLRRRDLGLRQLPDPSPDGIIADITGAVASIIGQVTGDVYSLTGEATGLTGRDLDQIVAALGPAN